MSADISTKTEVLTFCSGNLQQALAVMVVVPADWVLSKGAPVQHF